jgi:splicing factor 3B subunit 3
MTAFQGMLLVGVGKVLRLYELGRKQLLRKCEARGFPTIVKTLSVSVDRVFVGDGTESVHFCKYKRAENSLQIFADDTQPRHLTCMVVLDHDTVAGGDKFGNVFVLRLPSSVSDEVDAIGPTGSRLLWDSGKLGGAPTKATMIAQFHVGAAITSLSKAVLTTGGSEVLVYTTVTGCIGSLLPLGSKEDADFYTHMELFLRAEDSVSATGRDHLSYRSLYGPVSVSILCSPTFCRTHHPSHHSCLPHLQHVIDGDLCEAYANLPAARQKAIATDLDRNGPHEVLKKLEDVRNRVM